MQINVFIISVGLELLSLVFIGIAGFMTILSHIFFLCGYIPKICCKTCGKASLPAVLFSSGKSNHWSILLRNIYSLYWVQYVYLCQLILFVIFWKIVVTKWICLCLHFLRLLANALKLLQMAKFCKQIFLELSTLKVHFH